MISAGSPSSRAEEDLLPVRMVNEFAYCPRLFHLMHVEGRWADNVYTQDGKRAHARVDGVADQLLPDPIAADERPDEDEPAPPREDEPPTVSRSVLLSSATLGIVGKLDLVATDGADALPVETKRPLCQRE